MVRTEENFRHFRMDIWDDLSKDIDFEIFINITRRRDGRLTYHNFWM